MFRKECFSKCPNIGLQSNSSFQEKQPHDGHTSGCGLLFLCFSPDEITTRVQSQSHASLIVFIMENYKEAFYLLKWDQSVQGAFVQCNSLH